jgi:hypothetical protein
MKGEMQVAIINRSLLYAICFWSLLCCFVLTLPKLFPVLEPYFSLPIFLKLLGNKECRAVGFSSVVEHLPSTCKAPSLIHRTAKY